MAASRTVIPSGAEIVAEIQKKRQADEARARQALDAQQRERDETERRDRDFANRRAAIEAREAALPKLKKKALLNEYVRFTSSFTEAANEVLFLPSGLPEGSEFQVTDTEGQLVTLSSAGQHPGVLLPGAYLRVAKIAPSQLSSLLEQSHK